MAGGTVLVVNFPPLKISHYPFFFLVLNLLESHSSIFLYMFIYTQYIYHINTKIALSPGSSLCPSIEVTSLMLPSRQLLVPTQTPITNMQTNTPTHACRPTPNIRKGSLISYHFITGQLRLIELRKLLQNT